MVDGRATTRRPDRRVRAYSRTGSAQSAAYPFTRLRSDGVWALDHDVPMDLIGPPNRQGVVGRLTDQIEQALRRDPALIMQAAAALVDTEFPASVAPDVLLAVGLDRHLNQSGGGTPAALRRRSGAWPRDVLAAWDRQCALCGFDGQLGGTSIGIDAAHIRWFNFDGPDSLDNGLALCVLHHRLFDRGALGLTPDCRVQVSEHFTARTESGKRVYDLHDRPLRPRPGTDVPAAQHIAWHQAEVFQGRTLAA